jgi:hypothetical protein
MLYHKQGVYVVGWGQGTPEAKGLAYEMRGSGFGWRRLAKGEKPQYIMDDPTRRTPERNELGDTDESAWPVNDDNEPMDPWSRVAQLNLVRVQDGTPLIFETAAQSAIIEVENLVQKIVWLARERGDANPVIVTDTQQARNKKNQTWWIPTFTITGWNEPDGTPVPPEPEPQREDFEPTAKASAEQMYAVGGVPPASPRERKPRNAYAHLHAKPAGKLRAALKDELDDEIPY